jgi:Caspase domain
VIFLSGHGVEIEGHNFVLPSDVPFIQYGRQEQLKRESLSIDELLIDLRGRNPRVTLLILDACRENPMVPPEFKAAAGSGGLARMEPPEGTFIMYSAAANETALDRLPGGDSVQNSVYARMLLPLMRTNLSLPDLAQELRRQVRELALSAGHVQRPAYYDGLLGRFCLPGCDDAGVSQTTITIPSDPEKAWDWFRNTESEEALLAFTGTFRNTEFSTLAARRLDLISRKKTRLYIISIGISKYNDPQLNVEVFRARCAESCGGR